MPVATGRRCHRFIQHTLEARRQPRLESFGTTFRPHRTATPPVTF